MNAPNQWRFPWVPQFHFSKENGIKSEKGLFHIDAWNAINSNQFECPLVILYLMVYKGLWHYGRNQLIGKLFVDPGNPLEILCFPNLVWHQPKNNPLNKANKIQQLCNRNVKQRTALGTWQQTRFQLHFVPLVVPLHFRWKFLWF